MMTPLDVEFLALPFPSAGALASLRAAGVSDDTLGDPRCFVKCAPVVPIEPERFEFDADGVEALALACLDEWEEVSDILAFLPESPRRWRRYEGRALFLGEHVVSNPATYALGQPLRIFRDPLGWLKAGGHGALILDPARIWRRLLDVPAIAAEDAEHAAELATLRKPPLCRVLVPEAA